MENDNTLSIINGAALLALDVEPPRFIVAKLIPTGLHLLAGSPKVGKSWLALWLCHQVSIGAKVWEFDTQQCGALYISLEDTIDRLHLRLSRITEQGSKDTLFVTTADNLAGNLLAQLETVIQAYPDTGLIIIDTFQRIRDMENESTYANDYREVAKIKALADKFKLAILLVHHLRKAPDTDPFNMVSGSTGLIGAVDSIYVLSKEKRTENAAVLHVTGRDIEDMQMQLEFDREPPIWRFVGYGDQSIRCRESIVTLLCTFMSGQTTYTGTATELFAALGDNKAITKKYGITVNNLSRQIKENLLTLEKSHGIKAAINRTNSARIISLTRVTHDSDFTAPLSSPHKPVNNNDNNSTPGVASKTASPVTDSQQPQ